MELPGAHDFDSIKKVLVVDDNLMNQKLTSIILNNNGFTIRMAKNGMQAIEILKQDQVDLILMDIQMPVMDGYQTTKVIRDELRITTPVIAMSAHALSGEKEKCLQSGMNDYLSKPFKEIELLNKIVHWAMRQKQTGSCEQQAVSDKKVDLAFLVEQTRNNQAFIQEMIEIFRGQNPKDLSVLHMAIEKGDFSAIYKTVHTIRNTVGLFGLTAVIGDELLCIEKQALEKSGLDKIRLLSDKVSAVCREAVTELERLVSEEAGRAS